MSKMKILCVICIESENFNDLYMENGNIIHTSETFMIEGPNGKLNVIIQKPEIEIQKKYPAVILMHGLMSDSNVQLLVRMSDVLVLDGYITVRFDFDGCGKSDGDFVDMTVLKEVADAQTVYEYVRKLANVSDINLIGHSQGGVVASILAGQLGCEKIKSLTLLAAAASLEDEANEGITKGAHFDPNDIPEYITVDGKKIGKEYLDEAQNLNIYKRSAKYQGPVCIIHGRMDEVVKYSYSEEYQKIYKHCELFLLDNENHMFSENMDLPIDIVAKFLKKEDNPQ